MNKKIYITKTPPTEDLKTDDKWDLHELNNLESEEINYFTPEHRQLIKDALYSYRLDGTNNVEVELFYQYALKKARVFNDINKDIQIDVELLSSRPATEWYTVIRTEFFKATPTYKVIDGVHIDRVRLTFRQANKSIQNLVNEDVSHLFRNSL